MAVIQIIENLFHFLEIYNYAVKNQQWRRYFENTENVKGYLNRGVQVELNAHLENIWFLVFLWIPSLIDLNSDKSSLWSKIERLSPHRSFGPKKGTNCWNYWAMEFIVLNDPLLCFKWSLTFYCFYLSLRFDFFLVSQHVRQGTVTPTHYVVVSNNTGMKPDHIQR